MREFLLYGFALPLVLGFALVAWRRAYALYRQDRRERLALALARKDDGFSRALAIVREIGGSIPSTPPWTREEYGRGR